MKYIRFDIKCERKSNLTTDKFALISSFWKAFINNSKKAFVASAYVIFDEQLLPCKARCKFVQYMSNKPDKFEIKFFPAVDVEHKYMINDIPYCRKDENRIKGI